MNPEIVKYVRESVLMDATNALKDLSKVLSAKGACFSDAEIQLIRKVLDANFNLSKLVAGHAERDAELADLVGAPVNCNSQVRITR